MSKYERSSHVKEATKHMVSWYPVRTRIEQTVVYFPWSLHFSVTCDQYIPNPPTIGNFHSLYFGPDGLPDSCGKLAGFFCDRSPADQTNSIVACLKQHFALFLHLADACFEAQR